MRALLRLAVVVVVVAGFGVAGLVIVDRASDDAPEASVPAAGERSAPNTASVVRTDLIETEQFPGTLRYRDPRTVTAGAPGVVTALAEEGETVGRGEPLAEIDGEPVTLLYGARPAWRRLSTASADGPDVAQLEENLVALGLDPDGELTVDDDYTSVTARLVRDWQDDLGVDDTGAVELGRVVFLPGSARVGAQLVELGATVARGAPLLTVTGPEQEVVLDLDADRQDLATVGETVSVELPGNVAVDGTITAIGASARTVPGRDEPVVEVVVTLDDPAAAGGLSDAPVDVELVAERAAGVLAVPVEALLALAEGGYALEVTGGDGARLVAVEIGMFADGLVEVTGDVPEGATVVVP